jgi:phosphatidylglycerol:prolipoprotein diacylglycerol transferase
MLALGFAAGTYLAVRRATKQGIDSANIYNLSLLILVSSIAGARISHFVFHYGQYARAGSAFKHLFWLQDGGFMALGGFASALLASLAYSSYKKLPMWRVTDVIAPSVPLGLCLARIGCFLNGCCYGKPTKSWLGMTFPPHAHVYVTSVTGIQPGTPVLPTQIFESVAGLFMVGILFLFERYTRKLDGMIFGLMVVLFSGWRLIIEEYRYREADMDALNGMLSKNQVFSIVLILAGIAFLSWRYTVYNRSGILNHYAIKS